MHKLQYERQRAFIEFHIYPEVSFTVNLHKSLNYAYLRAFLVAQMVKTPPAMWETWILSLGWADPLEKGTTTHSIILAWRIPWTV